MGQRLSRQSVGAGGRIVSHRGIIEIESRIGRLIYDSLCRGHDSGGRVSDGVGHCQHIVYHAALKQQTVLQTQFNAELVDIRKFNFDQHRLNMDLSRKAIEIRDKVTNLLQRRFSSLNDDAVGFHHGNHRSPVSGRTTATTCAIGSHRDGIAHHLLE